ncbi:septal ring lytic transglycosylase RlpA family protein [Paraflavisolibacter sp. H34]|uniref:septal ring lytic transglycosylase RlpA family protein n=1 Tax=Huijunlia imazamoxiresistens TaxID=3127457 RepID=UPI0030187136
MMTTRAPRENTIVSSKKYCRMRRFLIANVITLMSLFASAQTQAKSGKSQQKKSDSEQLSQKSKGVLDYGKDLYTGIASYYADKFKGRSTASGSSYSHGLMTAACNVLPLGMWVRITNPQSNKSIIVQINDRMHKANKRLVDLPRACAEKLGYITKGITKVMVEPLGMNAPAGAF